MAKKYFDKFMEDQLRREAQNRAKHKKVKTEGVEDPKRELLRRHREHVLHLKVWKKNG